MKVVKLKPRDVLWVPMGWLSILVHWHDDAKANSLGRFIFTPCWRTVWAEETEAHVMQAIAAENANVLMKRENGDVWKHRAELFLDLLKQKPQ